MSASPLPHRIAEILRRRIAASNEARLPPVAALAQELSVSTVTAWKAVRILANEGLVKCRRGNGITIAGRRLIKAAASCNALCTKISDLITGGVYHTGDALPKISYFTVSEKCSRTTVVAALRRLELDRLAHRRGRQWIVGPPPKRLLSSDRGDNQGPIALFLVLNQVYWKETFRNSFTSPFISALLGELRKHHIGLLLAATHIPTAEVGGLTTGIDRVRDIIRGLGSRYQGAVLTNYSTDHTGDMFSLLRGLDRPAVEFNPSNEPGAFSCVQPQRNRRRRLYYLYLDESSAVRMVLDHLWRRGHRLIGLPAFRAPGYEWTQRRIAAIQRCAASQFPSLRIITVEQEESWWGRLGPDVSVADFLSALGIASSANDPVAPLPAGRRKQIIAQTPSLASLLQHESITAVIALNNELARAYYFWFNLAGISIPRQLSLISFDDTPESVTFPITTVDFGFSRLGYLAAHLLIGDIPVKADPKGNIPGICELVDRGSVRHCGIQDRPS